MSKLSSRGCIFTFTIIYLSSIHIAKLPGAVADDILCFRMPQASKRICEKKGKLDENPRDS